MKIIIDTNIIFSALLNSNGSIGDLIFNSDSLFEFYSCNFMKLEIQKHWKKLLKISKLSERELMNSYAIIHSKINFINEELVPNVIWKQAFQLTEEIDPDDTPFVALSIFLNGKLWTGDKVLYNGLNSSKSNVVYNTNDLLEVREILRLK